MAVTTGIEVSDELLPDWTESMESLVGVSDAVVESDVVSIEDDVEFSNKDESPFWMVLLVESTELVGGSVLDALVEATELLGGSVLDALVGSLDEDVVLAVGPLVPVSKLGVGITVTVVYAVKLLVSVVL